MEEGIHPKYGPARFECACGNVIETQSTRTGTIKIEICFACHPAFTGQQRLVDSAGRVEKFMRKFGEKAKGSKTNPKKAAKKDSR
jgi:large subunit ribosomal protein L31